MANDKIEILISEMLAAESALLGCETAPDGTLVQGMPCGVAGHKGRSRHTGYLLKLVNHTGIGDKSFTHELVGEIARYQAAKIAGMAAAHFAYISYHGVVYLVNSTRYRPEKTSAAYHRVKLKRDTVVGQCFKNKVLAKIKLINHFREWLQILHTMSET